MAERSLDKLFRTNIARNFVKQVQSSGGDCLFACIGSPTDSYLTERTERQENISRNNLLSATRIIPSDVCLVIDRKDWTTGTIYDKINDSIDMSTQNFYVLNRENNVYVCINNNGGLASTEEPTGTDTDDLSLGDGYIWKFMYTVPNDKLKFLDSKTIPIVELKTYDNESAPYSDARQFQYAAQKNALTDTRSGTIIRVDTSSPNTAVYESALPASINQKLIGSNPSGQSVFISDAINTTGTYNNYVIRIVSGQAAGQIKTIDNNVVLSTGANQVNLAAGTSFSPIPQVNDRYEILPRISVSGNGSGAEVFAVVDPSSLRIDRVVVKSPGKNYTTATASVETTQSSGTVPTLTPSLYSPIGENAVFELFATNVKMFTTMVPDNTNNVDRILENDYRNIAVWLNPNNGVGYSNAGKIASFSDVSKTNLKIEKKTDDITLGLINAGDFLYGESSNVFGKVFASTRESNSSATVTIENLSKDYIFDETLALLTSSGGSLSDSGFRCRAKTTFSDDKTLSPTQNTYRLATRLDIETVSGASVVNDGAVSGASGGEGTVVQYISDVNSVPPTGTLLLTNVSPSASSAALGFDTNERLTLPDSTGATVTNVFGPELELFSGKMLYIEGIDPVIRTFEQTDVLQLTFEF